MSWWLGKKGPILVTQFLRLHTGPSPQLSQTRAGSMPTMNSEDAWIQGQGFPESHTPVRTSQGHWQATDWADHDLHGHFWPRPCGDSKLPLTHRDTGLWLFKYGEPSHSFLSCPQHTHATSVYCLKCHQWDVSSDQQAPSFKCPRDQDGQRARWAEEEPHRQYPFLASYMYVLISILCR